MTRVSSARSIQSPVLQLSAHLGALALTRSPSLLAYAERRAKPPTSITLLLGLYLQIFRNIRVARFHIHFHGDANICIFRTAELCPHNAAMYLRRVSIFDPHFPSWIDGSLSDSGILMRSFTPPLFSCFPFRVPSPSILPPACLLPSSSALFPHYENAAHETPHALVLFAAYVGSIPPRPSGVQSHPAYHPLSTRTQPTPLIRPQYPLLTPYAAATIPIATLSLQASALRHIPKIMHSAFAVRTSCGGRFHQARRQPRCPPRSRMPHTRPSNFPSSTSAAASPSPQREEALAVTTPQARAGEKDPEYCEIAARARL
ncbi:hypothetical protein B0H13DRAFT_2413725 [Mycena leptocephala]|nr:hypothetical protein B0H13DRAFT_2413725 [Mycena leptocephala]